ncbi:MAG: hypothetical protein COW65_11550 [Cytophagales bacterium CG18_big_fil_WC_8_21_14_2_50_42_9]|nr:MAG: hypothetical protein COW65_11550 [Cytophagales bacterium CG18_big_fil_WC_8_21_14_2_50_42_9]
MPLYKKAMQFDPKNLENMTYDECYELLLCFRYLQFRNDATVASQVIGNHMEAIRKRIINLKGTANYQNII